MSRILIIAVALALPLGGPALAQQSNLTATGDAAAGEGAFRQCQSCHVVQDASGEVLAGRAARTGPNLHGVVGRVAGAVEDYDYSDLLVEAGEGGMIWDEASFVSYLLDPTGHLREVTGNASGRGKMAYRVRQEEDAVDLYAFLAQFTE